MTMDRMSVAEAVAALWKMRAQHVETERRYEEKLAVLTDAGDSEAELDRWEKDGLAEARASIAALDIACAALTIDPRD